MSNRNLQIRTNTAWRRQICLKNSSVSPYFPTIWPWSLRFSTKKLTGCILFQLVTGAPTTSPGSTGSGSNLSPSCGEGGPAVSPLSAARTGSGMTDPMTGQLLDSSSLAALSYPRLGGGMGALGTGMYGTSYPSTEQNPYPSISMENSAFYGSLVSDHICPPTEQRKIQIILIWKSWISFMIWYVSWNYKPFIQVLPD